MTMLTQSEALWRSLRYFSYYRLIVAGVFLGAIVISGKTLNVGTQSPEMFFWVSLAYMGAAIAFIALLLMWQQQFHLQLSLQVFTDILSLTLLLFASGGSKSGMAMMLLVVLAGAGLVGQGRMVLFYAALATLAILIEQSYRVLELHADDGDFFRTGLTSIGFFGSAIAARLLARRVVANEELARQRGVELADQMRINERVIRDMHDGVLVLDAEGNIQQLNPRARFLLGLLGTSIPDLKTSLPKLANEFLVRRMNGGESELVMSVPQSGRTLRVRFMPPSEGGTALVFLEDASRQQQQAQQVKLAALGRLTANMAHEIRNPLSAISHATELLAEGPPDPGMERLVRIIGDNTQRLNRLVSEVSELGRRDRASPESIDMCEFIRLLLEELSLKDHGIAKRIRVEIQAGFTACFDRGHLHRVINNLLSNALRHASDTPGAIRIYGDTTMTANRHGVHIVDDGCGIDLEGRAKVFEPFFTTRAGGTGLGLYIARELCEANGARLFMLENSPGAHFCISCAATCQNQSQNLVES